MPLFRKKSQSQAQRLAAWRSEALSSKVDDAALGPLFDGLGVSAVEESGGWVADVGGGRLFMTAIEHDTVLSGYLEVEDTHDPGELAALLERNLEPRLAWAALGDADDGPLGLRFAVPLDGFDRDAVLLALEALGDATLSAAARDARGDARGGARGELAEQEAETAARHAMHAALSRADLAAEPGDKHGTWRVATDRGPVDAVLRDTGESLLLMHELEYTGGDDDPRVLRWLLLASDWGGARLGLARMPGGPGLFAACAVPAHDLQPQALAWAVTQVLRLAEDYDEQAA